MQLSEVNAYSSEVNEYISGMNLLRWTERTIIVSRRCFLLRNMNEWKYVSRYDSDMERNHQVN